MKVRAVIVALTSVDAASSASLTTFAEVTSSQTTITTTCFGYELLSFLHRKFLECLAYPGWVVIFAGVYNAPFGGISGVVNPLNRFLSWCESPCLSGFLPPLVSSLASSITSALSSIQSTKDSKQSSRE